MINYRRSWICLNWQVDTNYCLLSNWEF